MFSKKIFRRGSRRKHEQEQQQPRQARPSLLSLQNTTSQGLQAERSKQQSRSCETSPVPLRSNLSFNKRTHQIHGNNNLPDSSSSASQIPPSYVDSSPQITSYLDDCLSESEQQMNIVFTSDLEDNYGLNDGFSKNLSRNYANSSLSCMSLSSTASGGSKKGESRLRLRSKGAKSLTGSKIATDASNEEEDTASLGMYTFMVN
eukprot:Awhi_evm1s14782